MATVRTVVSPMVADVGARIRALRTAKGLTQAQLADPKYTKAYISMLESGRTRASMKALEHIAGALGVRPSDLLGGATPAAAPQYALVEAQRLLADGRGDQAQALLEGLEEGLTPGDQLLRLRLLAASYNLSNEPKRSFPILERAQRMAELLGATDEMVRIKGVLAASFARSYAYDETIRLLKEVIESCEAGTPADPTFHFRRLVDLASAYTNARQPKQALPIFERAIELSDGFGNRFQMAVIYANLGKAHHDNGDLEAAIQYSQRSAHLYEEMGLADRLACVLDNVALLYAEHGSRERARECIARAAQLAIEGHRDTTLASIKATEAEILATTDAEAATDAAQGALKFARKVDDPESIVRSLLVLGETRLESNPAAARRSFNEARTLAEERRPQLLRVVYDRWSQAAEKAGDSDEALRLARRALETVRA